jgi:predicted ATPase
MQFRVVESRFQAPKEQEPYVLLESRRWDDYGRKTLFHAYHVAAPGQLHYLGPVKILDSERLTTKLDAAFETLPDTCCSLGQEMTYYGGLRALGEETCRSILTALHDVVYEPTLFARFETTPGFETSLLRTANAAQALAEGRRMFFPDAPPPAPAKLKLQFSCDLGFDSPHTLQLSFPEGEEQLGRMMVLIGRNGTGKTRLLAALGHALSGLNIGKGTIEPPMKRPVVVISFSPYDRSTSAYQDVPGYAYYGLRRPAPQLPPESSQEGSPVLRPRFEGAVDIDAAIDKLSRGLKGMKAKTGHVEEWRQFLTDAGVFGAEPQLEDPFTESVEAFLEGLKTASSGDQFLVFVATALVESVGVGSVVLFDEPELHLHPSLLSRLMRLLYDMLARRKAYAVLATHSPMVVQEVPAASVRIIRLEGRCPVIKRYRGESFGEDLTEILQRAYGVDEDARSYAAILEHLTSINADAAAVEKLFDGLGLGARMLLRDLAEKRAGTVEAKAPKAETEGGAS